MPHRRDQVLDAAIEVLGRHGVRQLTHRSVDAAAGVPAGTTSNHFRTREALVDAVVDRFAQRERAVWERIARQAGPTTAGELAASLAAFARDATGPNRTMTLARFAVFVEAALRPHLRARLAAVSRDIRGWGGQWLGAVGSTEPERHARIVLDQLDGIILHQLAFPDRAFDPAGELAVLIGALVSS